MREAQNTVNGIENKIETNYFSSDTAQLYRRGHRFFGLLVAFIAGLIFTIWLVTLLQHLIIDLYPGYDMPPIPYIYTVVLFMFGGMGYSLHAEWVIIKHEAKKLGVKSAF